MKGMGVMKRANAVVFMVSAFMMALSSAVYAAEDMLPSEYYKTEILGKDSGVYEYQGKIFVHSKAAYETKKPNAKNKAKLAATVGTGKLLRDWAIEQTAADRATKESLSDQDKSIRDLLNDVDDYWQFPDWKIGAKLQCVMDNRGTDDYVVGMCGDKDQIVSAIPSEYKLPCTKARLQGALPGVAKRMMQGDSAKGFMQKCGAVDLVGVASIANEKLEEFETVNGELADYVRNSPLAKELIEEVAILSVPQIATNRTVERNDQGTLMTERVEVVTTTRFPRMQKLFLQYATETNYPTGRLPSGPTAIASIRNAKIDVEARVKLFRQALCDSPGDKELWNFLGRAMMGKGDNLGAVICFRNALKLDDRFIYPIVNLAVAYKSLGKGGLSLGLAVVARGLATDAWSLTEVDKLLWGASTAAVIASPPSATAPVRVKQSSVQKDAAKQEKPATAVLKSKPEPVSPKPNPAAKPTEAFSSSEVNSEVDF